MWKYIIGIIVFAVIEILFPIDPYKPIREKRKKRLGKSFIYTVVACASYFIRGYQIAGESWKRFLLIFSIAAAIFALGSFLSAMNPNLREIFATMVIYAALVIGIYAWLKNSHFVWFCILEGFFGLSLILNVKESVEDMMAGIDPDVVEADKEAKKNSRKKMFKVAKLLFRAFYS